MTAKFKRGNKISFYGKDSHFEGFFISYIKKLPMTHGFGETTPSNEIRCVVQQRDTGTLLIKPNPSAENKGWKS